MSEPTDEYAPGVEKYCKRCGRLLGVMIEGRRIRFATAFTLRFPERRTVAAGDAVALPLTIQCATGCNLNIRMGRRFAVQEQLPAE